MALISAGCGSLVGRLLRFNVHDLRLATAVGIGIMAPTKLLGLVSRRSVIEAYESEAKKMMGEVQQV